MEIQYDILMRKYILNANPGYAVLGLACSVGPAISPVSEGKIWEIRKIYYILAISSHKIILTSPVSHL